MELMRFLAGLTCVALTACAVTACAVTHQYQPTAVAMPVAWRAAPVGNRPITQSTVAWWTLFHDVELTSLIERALAANLDVQLAQTRLREVRAQQRVTAASLAPALGAAFSAAREKDSANAPAPVLQNRDGTLESSSAQAENLFHGGFNASWELDLFARQQRILEGAQANLELTAFERDGVILSLLTEVARTYIELRTTQRQIAIANESLAALIDGAQLMRARYAGGMAIYAEIAYAELPVQQLNADIASMTSRQTSAANHLCVLLGQWPGSLELELAHRTAIPLAADALATGLPSDLLRQRPDILRDERRIAMTSADVGVATTELYPRFSLTGAAGLASVAARDLFSASSVLWKVGPTLSWPILRRGQIVATIAVRNAQMQEALIGYRKTILIALEEADTAITALARQQTRRAALSAALDVADQAAKLAQARYVGGLTDYRDVLAVKARWFQAQDLLAQSDAAVAQSQLALIKSFGGGWNAPTLNSMNAESAAQAAPRVPCSFKTTQELTQELTPEKQPCSISH